MNRHPSDRIDTTDRGSYRYGRYASTFGLSPKKKSRESIASANSISSKKILHFGLKSKKSPSIYLMKAFKLIRGPRGRRKSSLSSISTDHLSSISNVMDFLIGICPEEVIPKILAFAGPQKTAALSKVNRVWRDVIAEERTWRVLCEDLYKWTQDQPEPVSWKDYYMKNPVVPTDYPSIHAALAVVSNGSKKKSRQSGNVRVLVRPGRYSMPEAVTIHTAHRTTQITVEALTLPETFMPGDTRLAFLYRNDKRVTLLSKTRVCNEPLFRVLGGKLVLKNLCLEHMAMGVDIWRGNAAIQVQPNNEESTLGPSTPVAKAAAVLESVEIVSYSGRGIVVLDGAHVHIKDSYIHGCAATGVYVGGEDTRAVLETVDLTENGVGSQHFGGISRGQSGICIGEGVVSITDCNVSRNLVFGISVLSPGLTELALKNTDILTNGSRPIAVHYGNMDHIAITADCQLACMGSFSPRSTILVAELVDHESEGEI